MTTSLLFDFIDKKVDLKKRSSRASPSVCLFLYEHHHVRLMNRAPRGDPEPGMNTGI